MIYIIRATQDASRLQAVAHHGVNAGVVVLMVIGAHSGLPSGGPTTISQLISLLFNAKSPDQAIRRNDRFVKASFLVDSDISRCSSLELELIVLTSFLPLHHVTSRIIIDPLHSIRGLFTKTLVLLCSLSYMPLKVGSQSLVLYTR